MYRRGTVNVQIFCSNIAPSQISFYPITFYAAASSSQQRLRLRYFVTPDNSIMTGGTSGNCRKCQRDVEVPVYPGNSSKQSLPRPLLLPENVAQKKLPLIERSMAFQRVNMGRIYGKRHLQMFSHPSGVSFSLPPPPRSYCLSSVWVLSDWPACSATSSLPFASKDHKRSLLP